MMQQTTASGVLRVMPGLAPQAIRTSKALRGKRELSRSKRGVTEGIMSLAEVKWL
jgi:hypothetical protein